MMKRQRSWRRYTFMVFQFEKERMGEKMKKKLYLIVDEGIFEGNDLYDRREGAFVGFFYRHYLDTIFATLLKF